MRRLLTANYCGDREKK